MSTLKFKTSLDSTQYEKGVENIKGENTGLGGSLSGVQGMIARAFAVGALIAFGRAVANGIGKLINFGGAMTDLAYQTGVSVETLQGLMTEVRKGGGNSDTFTNSLARLREAQGAVVGGDKAMIAAFKELGLSQEAVAKMDTETLFRAMSKALTESGNSASAYSAVVDVLGKKNVPKLLEAMNALGSGTGELNQGFGKLTTANAQALDALSDGWANFWTDMKEGAANAIGEVVRGFSRLVFGRDIGAEGEARAKKQAEIEGKARIAESEKVKKAELEKNKEVSKEKKKELSGIEKESAKIEEDAAKRFGESTAKGDKFAAIGGRLGGFESQQLQLARQQVEIAKRTEEYLAKIAENTKDGTGLA
jgi:hypothetical protein